MNKLTEIVEFANNVAAGIGKVKPGATLRFTEACSERDRIWQGDMAITIAPESPPKGFVKNKKVNKQLVPGNTIGSKHCLASTKGVEQWVPSDWKEENLMGPWMRIKAPVEVIHPVHGTVEIPAGFCVQITYQREWDEEQRRERRAKD